MSELEDLAGLLNSKTVIAKIPWTMDDETRLHTIQGKNYVEVRKFQDHLESVVELTVRNKDGVMLAQEYFEQGSKAYAALDQIRDIVRRRSLGVDEALSDLRSRLEAL